MYRHNWKFHLFWLAIIPAILVFTLKASADTFQQHAELRLVSDVRAFAPGVPFRLGIYFEIEEDWHVYWRNPGDTGLAPDFEWNLPAGFSIGEIEWPFPKKIEIAGLINFAYENELLLTVQVTPPADLEPGDPVLLQVKADWLICKEECVPESADLSFNLAVFDKGFQPDEDWSVRFSRNQEKIPIRQSSWEFSAVRNDDVITIQGKNADQSAANVQNITFFPFDEQTFDYSFFSKAKFGEKSFSLPVKLTSLRVADPQRIRGILVSDEGWRGIESEKAIEVDIPINDFREPPLTAGRLLLFISFAFLGGLILNLMPCVLPVLSLKVLGLIVQAGIPRRNSLLHGAVFTAGVLASFWALAGILLILRTGGSELGWGFQLQSPAFIFVLTSFLFLLGLSLFGVFEIGISLTGLGGRADKNSGMWGSFVSGIMATIVATPCTAPFMGSALGFAVTQPVFISLLVFTFLGIGMASPYLLLTAFPNLLKFVPRPGAWMESLKQFMGFLMMATVVWLIWVFSLQSSNNDLIILLLVLLFLSLGAWIFGRWGAISRKIHIRRLAIALAILVILGSFSTGFYKIGESQQETISIDEIQWEQFSPDVVQSLHNAGQNVFIDFTAAWCLSCKVNERIALADKQVIARFKQTNTRMFKADWTSRDDEITAALAKYGRNSVPLYVLYVAGENDPRILPEILTPGIVLDALKKLETN